MALSVRFTRASSAPTVTEPKAVELCDNFMWQLYLSFPPPPPSPLLFFVRAYVCVICVHCVCMWTCVCECKVYQRNPCLLQLLSQTVRITSEQKAKDTTPSVTWRWESQTRTVFDDQDRLCRPWNCFKGNTGETVKMCCSTYALSQAPRYHLDLSWAELVRLCDPQWSEVGLHPGSRIWTSHVNSSVRRHGF